MKLSVLFLICSLSMTYAAESYAQKTMISLEVRNETVGTVLEKLKKESGFDFFFNNKHVDLKRIVSVSANNKNILSRLRRELTKRKQKPKNSKSGLDTGGGML